MFDYLQQFNRLSKDIQGTVSSPEAMKTLDETEAKHGVKLAAVVMRVMVKDLTLAKLPLFLASEFSLREEEAKQIVEEMKAGVFKKASTYLGFAPVTLPDDTDKKIALVLSSGTVSFAGQVLIDRFKSVAKTYLHGVRTKIDTRLAMQKSIEAGGLGLDSKKADTVFHILDGQMMPSTTEKKTSPLDKLIGSHVIQPEYSLAASIEERKKKLLSEKELPVGEVPKDFPRPVSPKAPVAAVAPDNLPFAPEAKSKVPVKPQAPARLGEDDIAGPDEIAAFLKKISQNEEGVKEEVPKVKEPEKKAPILQTASPEIKTPPPFVPPTPPIIEAMPKVSVPAASKESAKTGDIQINHRDSEKTPVINKPVQERVSAATPPLTPPIAPPIIPNRVVVPINNPAESGKVRMDDVRLSPRVMGPVEELRFMDVTNFRRLGVKPNDAVEKVLAKIKLLEKDGYDRMTAGISAWRQSEVNHLYLKICRESAFKARVLTDVIEDYKKQGGAYLSLEEIDAIMTLNAKLLF